MGRAAGIHHCIHEHVGVYKKRPGRTGWKVWGVPEQNLPVNPLKCEYFLPFVVDELLKSGLAEVTVLKSVDRWYGVTYKEDKEMVVKAIKGLKDSGLYPQKLWED